MSGWRRSFLLAPIVLTACAGLAQSMPASNIGEDIASVLISRDCRMLEDDLAVAMRNAGHAISDYQAQVIALYRGGYLSAPSPSELQLINWDECS
ncbi:MAG: hypothetical protein QNJ16_10605 [Rhodobacter sp.]|nr:hypothetical protein [Rhodobacter sp.]